MHPRTLRIYEEEGLVCPQRRNNLRLYSEADIHRVRIIRFLTRRQGVNLAGVKVILQLEALGKIRVYDLFDGDDVERFVEGGAEGPVHQDPGGTGPEPLGLPPRVAQGGVHHRDAGPEPLPVRREEAEGRVAQRHDDDGGMAPMTATCSDDGGVAVLTATVSEPPGIVLAWDVERTTYELDGHTARQVGSEQIRDHAADPVLRREMPDLFQPASLFADC